MYEVRPGRLQVGRMVSSRDGDPGPICGPKPREEGRLALCWREWVLLPLDEEGWDEDLGGIQFTPSR